MTLRHRPTGSGVDSGASVVTETNASPEFFAANQTQVDLDEDHPSDQRPESIGRSPTVTPQPSGPPVISGGLITGTASAMEAAPTKASRLGPYKHWYTCESTGNRGTESGRWEDYDCRGHNGAVYLYPRY